MEKVELLCGEIFSINEIIASFKTSLKVSVFIGITLLEFVIRDKNDDFVSRAYMPIKRYL
jgi:hypothetical protein